MGTVHAVPILAMSTATTIDLPTHARDINLSRFEAHVAKFSDSNPTPLRPASVVDHAKNG